MTGDFGRPTRPPTALTSQQVREGMAFVTWDLNDPKSRREGTFVSGVYTSPEPDDKEAEVVDVVWRKGPNYGFGSLVTTEVASSLGLCHDRHGGEYVDVASIIDDGEGE